MRVGQAAAQGLTGHAARAAAHTHRAIASAPPHAPDSGRRLQSHLLLYSYTLSRNLVHYDGNTDWMFTPRLYLHGTS